MSGHPGEPEEVTSEQLAAWSKSAVPANRVAFDVNGEGLLVIGRSSLAIRDDTVIALNYEQLAIAAGAFLSSIVAPGIRAARGLDLSKLLDLPGRPAHRPPAGADERRNEGKSGG